MRRYLSFSTVLICTAMHLSAWGEIPGDETRARKLLDDALQSNNPETRTEGVRAVSLVAGREPFTTRLEMMLSDGDVQVRVAAVQALAEIRTDRETAAIKTLLQDDVAEVRVAAAKALYARADPDGKEFLIAVLDGETPARSNLFAIRARQVQRTFQVPRALLMAAVKVGTVFAPVPYMSAGYTVVERALAHKSASGRIEAVLSVGSAEDPEAIEALRLALADKNAAVRAAAVQALVRDGQTEASQLVPLFQDRSQAVRVWAGAGYLRLTEQ